MGETGAHGEIEGVTLEQLVAAGVRMYGKDQSEWDEIAQAHGFPPGRFEAIAEAWTRRMSQQPGLAQAYNALYQREMVAAGVTVPDLTLEQYASLVTAGSGKSLEDALARFGLNMQQFSMLAQRWGERMMADPSLAMRYAQLIGALHSHPPDAEKGPEIRLLD